MEFEKYKEHLIENINKLVATDHPKGWPYLLEDLEALVRSMYIECLVPNGFDDDLPLCYLWAEGWELA